jgi:protein-arginine kinase activator protein McsA
MMACDICGKSEMNLQQLHKEYQTEEIKDICHDCSKKVNDHLWTLRLWASKMNEGFLKQWMMNMRRKLKAR